MRKISRKTGNRSQKHHSYVDTKYIFQTYPPDRSTRNRPWIVQRCACAGKPAGTHRLRTVRAISLAEGKWEAIRSVCTRASTPKGHGERKSQRQSAPPFTGLTGTVIGCRGAGTSVQPSCRKRGRMAEHISSRPHYRRKRVMREAARSMSRLASTSG